MNIENSKNQDEAKRGLSREELLRLLKEMDEVAEPSSKDQVQGATGSIGTTGNSGSVGGGDSKAQAQISAIEGVPNGNPVSSAASSEEESSLTERVSGKNSKTGGLDWFRFIKDVPVGGITWGGALVLSICTSLVVGFGAYKFAIAHAEVDLGQELQVGIEKLRPPPMYVIDTNSSVAMMIKAVQKGEDGEKAAARYSKLMLQAIEQVRNAGGYVISSESIIVGPNDRIIGEKYLKYQDELLMKEKKFSEFGYLLDSAGNPIVKELPKEVENMSSEEVMQKYVEKNFDDAIKASKSEMQQRREGLNMGSGPGDKGRDVQSALEQIMQ